MARPVQEINAGSMADIAFLLLIFFLVTTTMEVDSGIMRRLPPPVPPNQEAIKVKERNTFVVLVNSADMLLSKWDPRRYPHFTCRCQGVSQASQCR
jgi:biopolymer transport protein ExbD